VDYPVNHKEKNVFASQVAEYLGTRLIGDDFLIQNICSLGDLSEYCLAFSRTTLTARDLTQIRNACIITPVPPDFMGGNSFIQAANPRLAFAQVVSRFFIERPGPGIGEYTCIHPSASIADSVSIGRCCSIGKNVVIGEHTEIRDNVVIGDGVRIGKNCLIRSSSVIGEEGFGFELDESGTPIRIPHLGSVEIGDFVEIGNFTSVARGTLKNTVIHSHVKIDNLVHVAHNCIIGEKSLIIACAEISGSTVVGEKCWLGVGCSTIQKISVGSNSTIGVGAVVLHDVPPDSIMAGNPAKLIKMKTPS